ncbi:sugar-binding transcriptional regulator [Raineyella fluvialis]|nr:sugar-binding domain-containing protein [Raineyella fluvialis]
MVSRHPEAEHTATPLGPRSRARLAQLAELYWVDGHTVEDIGRQLGMSRSTVSRQLARARAEGVIEFVVHRDASADLAHELAGRYRVRADVVDVMPEAAAPARLEAVAAAAARRLASLIAPEMIATIAWGATIEAVARHLEPYPVHGVRIVQANGAGNSFTPGIAYAGGLMERFAQAFSGSVQLLPMPAFFDSAATREAMWREGSLQRVLRLRRSADLLVTSIGTVRSELPGHLYRGGYLGDHVVQELLAHGVVGDLAGMFFRADGSFDAIGANDRSTGLPLGDLRRIRTRLVVAAGGARPPRSGRPWRLVSSPIWWSTRAARRMSWQARNDCIAHSRLDKGPKPRQIGSS